MCGPSCGESGAGFLPRYARQAVAFCGDLAVTTRLPVSGTGAFFFAGLVVPIGAAMATAYTTPVRFGSPGGGCNGSVIATMLTLPPVAGGFTTKPFGD